ncbi:MAG: hypothetical protein ABJV04_06700 [Aliiglaciecola sp.]|uniref:hypothetical protein n=1 Tax=Aliiglaciecola sp. TaxID=1872441 RepID=UPI0032990C85
MYKFLMMILLVSFSTMSEAVDYDFSVGAGSQYGGFGTQFAIKSDKTKYFVGLGFPGFSVGMKRQFSENTHHSWGLNAGKMYGILSSDTVFGGITYNYHFNGFNNKGWELGTGITYYEEDEYTQIFGGEQESKDKGVGILINLGYVF